MFCPKCRAEFLPSQKKCPECGVDLVEELPPEFDAEPPELEKVFESDQPVQISVVRSILSDADIDFIEKGEGLQTIYAIGLVKFMVHRDDAATARELLQELENIDFTEEKEDKE